MRRTGLWMGLLVFMILSLMPLTVSAQENEPAYCRNEIVDQAKVFGDGTNQVMAAVNQLVRTGADVRVVTMDSHAPYENLDLWKEVSLDICGAWQSGDGGMKNNLVVVAIAMNERSTGVYHGDQWQTSLGSRYENVISDFMNPKFRDGDFAGGFVAGLNEINRMVDLQLHPQSQVPAAPSVVVIVPTQVPVQPAGPPPDMTGLWLILGGLMLIFIIFTLVRMGLEAYSNHRRDEDEKRMSQQKARVARQAAATRITQLTTLLKDILLRVQIMQKSIAEAESMPIVSDFAKVNELFRQATGAYGDANSAAGDPNQENLSAAEYQTIERSFNEVVASLDAVSGAVTTLVAQLNESERAIDDLPKIQAAAEAAVPTARMRIDAIAVERYIVEVPLAKLGQLAGMLAHAASLREARQLTSAMRVYEQVRSLAEQAAELAESYPQRRAALEQRIKELDSRLQVADGEIEIGRQAFNEISDGFAPRSWEVVKGNGTEAEKRRAAAGESIDAADAAILMDVQKWDEASEHLNEAERLFKQIYDLMLALTALLSNLKKAKASASDEIEAAAKDIETARAYIAQYDDDISEERESELSRAQQQLDDARTELKNKQPDYLVVVKFAQAANSAADKILEVARNEKDTNDRLRRKLATSLRSATATISTAEVYVKNHYLDVEETAEAELRDAKRVFDRIANARTLQEQVDLSEEAVKKAESALKRAKEDVDDAEERRRPAPVYVPSPSTYSAPSTPRRSTSPGSFGNWGSPHTSRPSSSPSSSPSSRPSGGSSSFGSSSRGGGGSIKIGGSSRGGGGSKGW